DAEILATIRNITADGVGLHMDEPLAEGTVVIVEPFHVSEARTLLARVARLTPESGGWLHGCELTTRLSETELHTWLYALPGAAPDVPLGPSCRGSKSRST